MLRINLLPSYVAQRRLTRQTLLLFTVLFSSIVAVALIYSITLHQRLTQITDDAARATAAKQTIDDINTQATQVAGQLPAISEKVDFVKKLQEYNLSYVKLYRNIARYTSPDILYTSLAVSGTSLTISAYAPSLPALARYMQIMYNEPDISKLSVSAIPGYKAAYAPSTKDYSIPELPRGFVARFPGSPVPVKTFTVVNGQVTKIAGVQDIAGPQRFPKYFDPRLGFDFTVTATLRGQLSPPALPAVAGAAPAAGAGGPEGFGGPGGPGGPPGGPGAPPQGR
ncbi:MAG TPA: hypothetical protein VGK19_00245 [Capsulimonadaceae bacterium]|jgi:Tfp pilus assembly protein PilN